MARKNEAARTETLNSSRLTIECLEVNLSSNYPVYALKNLFKYPL